MAIFKCKICGGALEINTGDTISTCEYCGTKQTLPKLDDEKKANLFERANHFRRNNDFDKAMSIYEQILNEDAEDAESYWSIVLCRYGIEYVEDPSTHKRVPTVNRAQFTSVFDDEDYKSAIKYADNYQKDLYEQEARTINEIQKGILAISGQEEPFDVFICYKETDNNGRRTQDSVLATELYHELTKEGFKVFFSRITLEDKLGVAYEPYIFAALHSAKVMVALGTKPEHFNAVWVKNEWSRYLSLIKNGANKILIPAYRDMDPYDLPEEFSHLQAQDMSKLGFMQDLVRGIGKITTLKEKQKELVPSANINNFDITPLVKRAFIFLEDGNFKRADELCEEILNKNPECAEAYIIKLMLELNIKTQDELSKQSESFEDKSNYKKAYRYANITLKQTLKGYIKTIQDRIEKEKNEKEQKRQHDIYSNALELIKYANTNTRNIVKIKALEEAAKKLKKLTLFEEAKIQIQDCEKRLSELYFQRNKVIRRIQKTIVLSLVCLSAVIGVTLFSTKIVIPTINYARAEKAYINGDYYKATKLYENLKDYKDSNDKVMESRYILATQQLDCEKFEDAYNNLKLLKDYKDSNDKLAICAETFAKELIENGNYQQAVVPLSMANNSEEVQRLKNECYLSLAKEKYNNKEYDDAVFWYERITNYDKNADFYIDSCYQVGLLKLQNMNYQDAIQRFEIVGEYKDAKEKNFEAKYTYIQEVAKEIKSYENRAIPFNTQSDIGAIKRLHKSIARQKKESIYKYVNELKEADYKDAKSIYSTLYDWKAELTCINEQPDDYEAKKSVINNESSYLHFQFDLSGGIPGETGTFFFKLIHPNGYVKNATWVWDNKGDGDVLGCEWSEGFSVRGRGTMKIEIYHKESNKLIGAATVKVQ